MDSFGKEIISSARNESIKNITKLLKDKKARSEQGLLVIEGIRIVSDVVAENPDSVESVYMSEELFERDKKLAGTISGSGVRCGLVKTSVFEGISDTISPQGILAVVKQPSYTYEDIVGRNADRIRLLVLEDVRDPGNLGTMVRTAEAAGMSGIIMSRGTTDIFSPKVTRSTMGSLFRVPFMYADDLPLVLDRLKADRISVYAAYLHGGRPFDEVTFGERAAVLVGNEANGLSDEAVEHSSDRVFIPMKGRIESLNAAIAAALLMYRL